MSAAHFAACLAFTLAQEGGFVDHPADPGGATNLGITRRTLSDWRKRPASRADVAALSRREAAEIYRHLYWDAVRGDELPAGLDAVLFDHAVNSGPRAAVKLLQRVLGLPCDGVFGRETLQAVRRADARVLTVALCRARRGFFARLKTFRIFGRGWLARVARLERHALSLTA